MFRNNRILRSLYKQFVSCTSCDTKITTSGQCNICQVKPFSKQNYFELLQQKTTYSLDIRQLRNKFLMEQAKWHPDLFTNKTPLERQESDLKSTKLNKAYEVIKDPLSRAHYLVLFN
jgi:molecular chaperone HscB